MDLHKPLLYIVEIDKFRTGIFFKNNILVRFWSEYKNNGLIKAYSWKYITYHTLVSEYNCIA